MPWSYPESSRFSIDRAIVISDKVRRSSTLFASIILVSEEYHHLPIIRDCLWTCHRMRQPATAINGHQFDYDCDSIDSITRSAILVLPQTQKFAGGKISGFERKSFTRQNSPDSKVSGFKVPTLNSGFKISGDMTKPGSFYFGFVHLCVNGKTNPVLKRSGFVTNPEQLSPV